MKLMFILCLIGCVLAGQTVNGQLGAPPKASSPGVEAAPGGPATNSTAFTQFDLDFPGALPEDLVRAIEKATGKPLNVIIPNELRDTMLMPLKMKNVTVPQLFAALAQASQKSVAYVTGTARFGGGSGQPYNQYNTYTTSYGFKTQGPPTEDSIWYFYREQPALPPATSGPQIVCRFYQLAPYLEKFTVDDITTAVQTAWKMLDAPDTPKLSFHKETKLLIAVGEPSQLELINSVLEQLRSEITRSNSGPRSTGRTGPIIEPRHLPEPTRNQSTNVP